MQNKLTQEELSFVECLLDPVSATEIIWSDLDNLASCTEGEFAHMRTGQIPMLGFEYIIEDDPELTEKQNFALKEGAGTLYNEGGRNYGKSLITIIVDECLSLIHHVGWDMGFSSYDEPHIYGVQNKVANAMKFNPFLNLFFRSVSKHPSYVITGKNGSIIEAVNMRIKSSKDEQQGEGFFQKHHKKRWTDEHSFETNKVNEKKIDATHELGCIERCAGMTNFTKYSPAGKIFYDPDLNGVVLNLPQYVNPFWDKFSREKSIKKHGGRESIGYRIFVEGKVVEDGESALDIKLVRECYKQGKEVKYFELDKESYQMWKGKLELFLSVDRPAVADSIWISADIGESAPTEINVYAEVKGKYRWIYNIVLRQLTDKEQFLVFQCLGTKLKANFIGLDCTDGTGRAIYRRLDEVFPKENLVWVHFGEKISTVPEKDENGKEIMKNGKMVFRDEYVVNWAHQRAKDLLYGKRMELPMNHKFDEQANSIVVVKKATRTTYHCIASEDHCWQAFQVFTIMQWLNELNLIKPVMNKKRCKAGS